MIAGPHCYSFFEGNDHFAKIAEEEITTFYLTDFLVRQFEAFILKPMGLDRHPKDCAAQLGLTFERRLTGYGDLETTLARL